ncbi:ABC transporter permease [Paenibacillus pinihumi]|uniref:ABC transporter permease n=1 Tax=Paenibacillus pinihumi TaxID=669462 RepID=UPI000409FBB3|nr:ABC transporter permease [Paenibacillus pinihumi]
MKSTIFAAMLGLTLKDKITLFYSLIFPLALLIGLGMYFDTPEYQEKLIAGVTALGALFWGVQGIAFQVYQQRSRGVYKLLMMTPFSILSFILTVTLARTVVGLAINGIILATGLLLFGLTYSIVNLLLFTGLLLLGTLCFTALGFVIANLASNEGQINSLSNLLQIPMIFGSSAFYSLEQAPAWIKLTGEFFPFAHMINGQTAALTGQLTEVLVPMSLLFLFTVLFVVLAAVTFRWDSRTSFLAIRRQY